MKPNILYIDPPWPFRNRKTGGSMTSGAAQKYQTLTLAQLLALPIRDLARRDALCALWVPAAIKPWGLRLLARWGFDYKFTFYWIKTNSDGELGTGRLGMGFWFRNQIEELLFGVRGTVPAPRVPRRNYLALPIGRHSAKPDEFRGIVELAAQGLRGSGSMKRLELFATARVAGWETMGMAIDGRDIRDAIRTRLLRDGR